VAGAEAFAPCGSGIGVALSPSAIVVAVTSGSTSVL
jgi:hypothetical protein